ncbi:MAG: insulinase family protein [Bacteroidetes bacterium]|nr:insulinase family protein [Bacteroidota bacterium]
MQSNSNIIRYKSEDFPGIVEKALDIEEIQLSNGMHAVFYKTDKIPSVCLNTIYHVGAKDDGEKSGIAHLFEHLMFEGSPNVPHGKFDSILHNLGGESNAYTSWDVTSYYITVPSNSLEIAMWLDSDRLAGFGITKEMLEIQKGVVSEERNYIIENTPYGSVEDESSLRLFKNSGYRNSILGNISLLKKLTPDDIRNHYDKYYAPNNAVIALAGSFDIEHAKKLVEKYYGGIPVGKPFTRNEFNEYDIKEEIKDTIYDNIQLPAKFIYYRVPAQGTKDYYALQILSSILSKGESSLLNKKLVYDLSLANEVDTSVTGMEQTSIFGVSAISLKGRNLDIIGAAIDETMDEIHSGNIKDEEIEKVKNKIETRTAFKKSSIVTLAENLSFDKLIFGDAGRINTEIFNFLSITKQDIIEAANKYLNKNQRVVLDYLPK